MKSDSFRVPWLAYGATFLISVMATALYKTLSKEDVDATSNVVGNASHVPQHITEVQRSNSEVQRSNSEAGVGRSGVDGIDTTAYDSRLSDDASTNEAVPAAVALQPDGPRKDLELPETARSFIYGSSSPKLMARSEFLDAIKNAEASPWSEQMEERINALVRQRLLAVPKEVADSVLVKVGCMGDRCQIQIFGRPDNLPDPPGMTREMKVRAANVAFEVQSWITQQVWYGRDKEVVFAPQIGHIAAALDGRPYTLLLLSKGEGVSG